MVNKKYFFGSTPAPEDVFSEGGPSPLRKLWGTDANGVVGWYSIEALPRVIVYYSQSVVKQEGFATDTYLVGAQIAVANASLFMGSRYHAIFDVSKTGSGIGTPVLRVRYGTTGSIADPAVLTFDFRPGTEEADRGTFEIWATWRSEGTASILQGLAQCRHRLVETGLQDRGSTTVRAASELFISSVPLSVIGVSVDGGVGADWTVQLVQAELTNLQ